MNSYFINKNVQVYPIFCRFEPCNTYIQDYMPNYQNKIQVWKKLPFFEVMSKREDRTYLKNIHMSAFPVFMISRNHMPLLCTTY